jgi:hypothetical protein
VPRLMKVRRVLWKDPSAAQDIHVLPGQQTRNLKDSLLVQFDDQSFQSVSDYLIANRPPLAELTFLPLFKKITSAATTHSGFGITVDTTTGVVSVQNPLPTETKSNFIIEITLKTQGRVFREVVRCQVHRSVTNVWLTPDSLTVRPGATKPTEWRFTVRAEFDDKIVGDVTDYHGVTWQSSPVNRVDRYGYLRHQAGDTAASNITITARLPTSLGGLATAACKMNIASDWSLDPARPKAVLVEGGGWPGASAPEKVPNVLFLSDGFIGPTPEEDHVTFGTFVDLIVRHLKTSRFTRPYDLLSTSMNFWRASMPAASRGLSIREEVYISSKDGMARALPPALPAPTSGDWKIEHLIYTAGYPVPNDPKTVDDDAMTAAAMTVRDIRALWQRQLDNPPPVSIPPQLILDWRDLGNRTFVDEQDGFPGVAQGIPPTAGATLVSLLRLHSDRGGEPALQAFFAALAAQNGIALTHGDPLGKLWIEDDPSFQFNNTELVVVLCSFPGGRPNNGRARHIVISTKVEYGFDEKLSVTKIANRNAYRLNVPPIPSELPSEIFRVVPHELAHSFGLGDEYTVFDEPHPQDSDEDLDIFANLQFASQLLSPAPGGGPQLLGSANIKWDWHRITKAAVIDGQPTPIVGSDRFRIPVRLDQGRQFAQGDHVLLRLREQKKPLPNQHVMTILEQEIEIADPPTTEAGPPPVDVIVVKALPGRTLAAAALEKFTQGSLLFIPTPAPASVRATNPYAFIVAQNIKDFIDKNHKALALDSTALQAWVYPDIPGVILPPLFCRACTPLIVGLYPGGRFYAKGVFHPAGLCMMNPPSEDQFSPFCMACQYALVDFVNPYLHWSLDRDYAVIYPQP